MRATSSICSPAASIRAKTLLNILSRVCATYSKGWPSRDPVPGGEP